MRLSRFGMVLAVLISGTVATVADAVTLRSFDVPPEEAIKEPFTCDGDNISPSFSIAKIPEGARSLVLIMKGTEGEDERIHWVLYNIDPLTTAIEKDASPGEEALNDFDEFAYQGPCPDSGVGRYRFELFVLDTELSFEDEEVNAGAVWNAMQGHILEQDVVVGTYGS